MIVTLKLISSLPVPRIPYLIYCVFFNQMKIQSEETEEMAKFKELFPDMSSPDSLYDKSPVK